VLVVAAAGLSGVDSVTVDPSVVWIDADVEVAVEDAIEDAVEGVVEEIVEAPEALLPAAEEETESVEASGCQPRSKANLETRFRQGECR
jgi:hypothetical protein